MKAAAGTDADAAALAGSRGEDSRDIGRGASAELSGVRRCSSTTATPFAKRSRRGGVVVVRCEQAFLSTRSALSAAVGFAVSAWLMGGWRVGLYIGCC